MKAIKYLLAIACLCLAMVAHAERVGYQAWVSDLNGQSNEAYTSNGSQSSFGVYCSGEKCLFYLHQSLKCDPGTKYSVLMNSQAVSTALSMECSQIGGHLFQILDPFEAVLRATQVGETIGFAVALQSGAFAVTRFNLAGSKQAIERALFEAAKSKFKEQKLPLENTPKSTLKDVAI
jgi:hypothetical protein